MGSWRRLAGAVSEYRAVAEVGGKEVVLSVRKEALPKVGIIWWGFADGIAVASGKSRILCSLNLALYLREKDAEAKLAQVSKPEGRHGRSSGRGKRTG